MTTKLLLISSQNRTAGTSSDFTITDNIPFVNKAVSIKLESAHIPMSFNNVLATNNQFAITGSTSGTNTITIPPSNYSGTSLAEFLAAELSSVTSETYTVEYDEISGKFTISSSTESFSLDFTVANTAAAVLGFAEVVTASAMSHESTTGSTLADDDYLFVCTDIIRGVDNGVIVPKASVAQTHALDAIPICCSGSVVDYSAGSELPYHDIKSYNYNETPRTIRWYLTLSDGTAVDLNGQEWSAKVLIKFI